MTWCTYLWVVYHDEFVELADVLELGVTVQEECGVFLRRLLLFVEGLQVLGQVVDSLGIKELFNGKSWSKFVRNLNSLS